jgi:acetyl esterase/lipase
MVATVARPGPGSKKDGGGGREHMKISTWKAALAAALAAGVAGGAALAAEPAPKLARPVYTPDGVVHVPAFDLPPSRLMSPEAVELLKMRSRAPSLSALGTDVGAARAALEKQLAPQVQMMRARYPADVVEQTIAGVPTRVFTPKGGRADPDRVLINLHGGGFMFCADACAFLESLPIASLGGFKVVSVNYRMGPEAVFPAASEDVAAVYRELLKSYKPKQIGVYGCSAGGALSGQAAAWFAAHGIPEPGAIGVFGSGAGRIGGDSAYVSGYIDGSFPPPPAPGASWPEPFRSYFTGADLTDPLVTPALHPDVLTKFPPTLVITGARAPDLSAAVFTHSQLVKAGVPGDLIVGEGMSHCYIYMSSLPEAQDAYQAIVRFFRTNLAR